MEMDKLEQTEIIKEMTRAKHAKKCLLNEYLNL